MFRPIVSNKRRDVLSIIVTSSELFSQEIPLQSQIHL